MHTYKLLAVCFYILTHAILITAESLVFIHIGDQAPKYLYDALYQARLFNPNENVYLLASPKAVDHNRLKTFNIILIDLHSLQTTPEHQKFSEAYNLRSKFVDFFRCTSERFLYLNDFLQQYDVKDVIHLENDILLYNSIETMLTVLKNIPEGIAAVFDNDTRCIPSFVYIRDKEYMQKLANYFTGQASSGKNDMEILALFKRDNQAVTCSLPIIMDEYLATYPLKSPSGHQTQSPLEYCALYKEFDSIFDGAAIGQFLGGIDPIHSKANTIGFINESCLFNPAHFEYVWIKDEQERKVPYALFKGKLHRINNLHIHSKNLASFLSIKFII